jgi:TPR repeat protein
VVVARLCDAAGCTEEAMRCWRRAAKGGHLEAQLLFGLALYRGSEGVAQDAEDAHLWLSRAIRQVAAAAATSSSTTTSGSSGGGSGVFAAAAAHAPGCGCCGALVAAAAEREAALLANRVLSQGGLVLGYLCFDGEGMRIDVQEAVRYFKLAAGAGNKEAQQVLGWMYNTGQFG